MKKQILFPTLVAVIFGVVYLIPNIPSFAEESLEDLKKQIEKLRAEVSDLKTEREPRIVTKEDSMPGFWGSGSSSYWDPFSEMQQMQDRMNRLFRDSFRRSSPFMSPAASQMTSFFEPDLDIQDKKDHYIMTLDIPGMDKNKINIEATDHAIVISGERNYQSEEQDDEQGFYRMERRFGSFSRPLPLPEDATSEGIDAKYEKGVLEIKIPKASKQKSSEAGKKINVT